MSTKSFWMSREQGLAERRWLLLDAEDQVLGRLATQAANLLRGKGKPTFTPSVDCGDFVVVVNAAKVKLSGNKESEKIYTRHTGYPGGLRYAAAGEVRAKHPERLVYDAVVGMLPKNRLGRALATKLRVYAGPDHPHAAQTPAAVVIGG